MVKLGAPSLPKMKLITRNIVSPELIQAKQEHSFSLTGDNCVNVDCVKEKIRYLCETGQQPRWIDCIVIQHCLDLEKQQSMYCAGGLLSSNSDPVRAKFSNNNSKTESCNSYDFGNKTRIRDFLDKSWCYSYSQQPVVTKWMYYSRMHQEM